MDVETLKFVAFLSIYTIIILLDCSVHSGTSFHGGYWLSIIINPRRACAARVTVVVLCVCLSVCLSTPDYSRTTGYEAAYERYQHLQCHKGTKRKLAILLKRLRSRDMA